jgi:hypothetical protein
MWQWQVGQHSQFRSAPGRALADQQPAAARIKEHTITQSMVLCCFLIFFEAGAKASNKSNNKNNKLLFIIYNNNTTTSNKGDH